MIRILLIGVVALGVAFAVGCKSGNPEPTGTSSSGAIAERIGLRSVPSDEVCMVNDRHMGVRQIPVAVGERTYFGCCEMCEGRLKKEAGVRSAVDPISGRQVDKAAAVIGARPGGAVLYFESEETLRKFAATLE